MWRRIYHRLRGPGLAAIAGGVVRPSGGTRLRARLPRPSARSRSPTSQHRDPGAGYYPLLARRNRPLLAPPSARRAADQQSRSPPIRSPLRGAARTAADHGLYFKIPRVMATTFRSLRFQLAGALERPPSPATARRSRPRLSRRPTRGCCLRPGPDHRHRRVADPSSVLVAPIVDRFGWALDDHDGLPRARSSAICAWRRPLCGGYFADPDARRSPAWRGSLSLRGRGR